MADDSDKPAPAPSFQRSSLPSVAAMLATLQAGKMGQRALGGAISDRWNAMSPVTEVTGTPLEQLSAFTRKEVQDLTDFAASKGVTTPMMAGGVPGNAMFFPGMPMVARNMDPAEAKKLSDRLGLPLGLAEEQIVTRLGSVPVMMHEIGHASPILGSTLLRNIWQNFGAAVRLVGGPARAGLMLNAITAAKDDETDARGFARDHAPLLVGATAVPQLLEEARATKNALVGARKFGPGVAQTAKELLPAYGTYALAAATPMLATLIAQKVLAALRGGDAAAEKTAATAGKEVQSPGLLRASASAAWHTGMSAPKPKTTRPNTNPSARAKETAKAKPPSKSAYFSDTIKSLNNPQRGYRGAKVG